MILRERAAFVWFGAKARALSRWHGLGKAIFLGIDDGQRVKYDRVPSAGKTRCSLSQLDGLCIAAVSVNRLVYSVAFQGTLRNAPDSSAPKQLQPTVALRIPGPPTVSRAPTPPRWSLS